VIYVYRISSYIDRLLRQRGPRPFVPTDEEADALRAAIALRAAERDGAMPRPDFVADLRVKVAEQVARTGESEPEVNRAPTGRPRQVLVGTHQTCRPVLNLPGRRLDCPCHRAIRAPSARPAGGRAVRPRRWSRPVADGSGWPARRRARPDARGRQRTQPGSAVVAAGDDGRSSKCLKCNREEPMDRDSLPDAKCGYVTWVGSYLLAALDPADRSEFVVHIRTCGRCRDEIVTLAELPSILARAYRTGAL